MAEPLGAVRMMMMMMIFLLRYALRRAGPATAIYGKPYHKGRVKTLVDPELFDHQSESFILQKKRKVPF
jgi:hypothetical protein